MKTVQAVPVNRDLEEICCYAMRYALRRQSYAVESVIGYLRRLLPHVRDIELYVWQRDIEREYPADEETLLEGDRHDGFSAAYFRALWMGFLRDIREEERRRAHDEGRMEEAR